MQHTFFYAGTSLSCAGIQRWKSVSFHCWTAKNLVGELRRRRMTPHPYQPTLTVRCEEFCILAFLPHSELWRVLHSCLVFVYFGQVWWNITLQCRHTETPGVRLVWLVYEVHASLSTTSFPYWSLQTRVPEMPRRSERTLIPGHFLWNAPLELISRWGHVRFHCNVHRLISQRGDLAKYPRHSS